MSLKVWKTLHVQKQTRSNVSSHRDTRMGNATVWLTTMQSFVENFAAICFWDYAQQSAMCGARRQHHVATSRCKILFDRLVVKKLFWPCISRSKQAFSRQSSNHEVQHFDPTQALFSDCLMLFASGSALGTQLQTAPAGFSLRSTMNPVMHHARPSRSSSHAVRGSTQTEATHANRMSSSNQRLYTKRLQVSETNILHATWASSCMSNL